jgi:CDP-diacylglycerol---glycerol-3-phosphate 3-phosphatidyltransferase
MSKRSRKFVKERLLNVPNTVTSMRVLLAIVLIVLYLSGWKILSLLYVFIAAAFTDFLDGFLARRLKQETLFGARFDILADRILWIIFGLLLAFGYPNQSYYSLFDFALIFSREILSGIFLIIYMVILGNRKIIPHVRYSGKVLTVIQGIVIPAMILSESYSFFAFYRPLIILCVFFGVVCSFYYIFDLVFYNQLKKSKFISYYDFVNPVAPAPYHEKN